MLQPNEDTTITKIIPSHQKTEKVTSDMLATLQPTSKIEDTRFTIDEITSMNYNLENLAEILDRAFK